MADPQVLRTLRNTQDFSALKKAVLAMCGPSGPVTSYQLIFNSNKRIVSCLLEMKWPLPDSEMREFGAYGFGNMVCLEFEVVSGLESTSVSWALPARRAHSPFSRQEAEALAL